MENGGVNNMQTPRVRLREPREWRGDPDINRRRGMERFNREIRGGSD